MSKAVTCTCSDMQLYHVGCDCVASREAKRVHVWLKGYASDAKATIIVDGGLDVDAEVRKQCGSFAKAYSVTKLVQYPVIQHFKEYIDLMSKHDNS